MPEKGRVALSPWCGRKGSARWSASGRIPLLAPRGARRVRPQL